MPAQALARLRMQSIHPNLLDRLPPRMVPVLTTTPLRQPDQFPDRRPIASSRKMLRVHKGLHQARFIPVELLPVAPHPAQGLPQDMRSQIGHAQPGQNQKPAIGNHLLQMFAARLLAPANPAVACLEAPGRGAKGQPAQPFPRAAADRITDLRSAQRPCALGMIAVQVLVPGLGGATPGDAHGHDLHRLQLRVQHELQLDLVAEQLVKSLGHSRDHVVEV